MYINVKHIQLKSLSLFHSNLFLSKLHHAQNAHGKLAENGSLFKRDVSVQLLVITAAVDHPAVEKRAIRSCGVQASVLSAF